MVFDKEIFDKEFQQRNFDKEIFENSMKNYFRQKTQLTNEYSKKSIFQKIFSANKNLTKE